MQVREATDDDALDVRRVLDAAMLEVREDLSECIDSGDVLVAEEGESILGALVLVPKSGEDAAYIDAVAVRRARRAQGVGTALVGRAAEREGQLTAEFDADVRPFYEALGFDVSPVEGADGERGEQEESGEREERDRFWGVLD
ncbi:GNAT family N-acetyltransferase [Halorussus halophilus]|uniref:GNAT family N-acetyltransferase n=1 Tax=Halorussus halophilus TaxID=2650975 RepID=UPI001301565B|nr:GNAT family N-acetyltransferase [Halorussus halophilus]